MSKVNVTNKKTKKLTVRRRDIGGATEPPDQFPSSVTSAILLSVRSCGLHPVTASSFVS